MRLHECIPRAGVWSSHGEFCTIRCYLSAHVWCGILSLGFPRNRRLRFASTAESKGSTYVHDGATSWLKKAILVSRQSFSEMSNRRCGSKRRYCTWVALQGMLARGGRSVCPGTREHGRRPSLTMLPNGRPARRRAPTTCLGWCQCTTRP